MKFRGVSNHKEGGFVANIGHNGKHVYLGHFREFDTAKQARLDAEVRLFGGEFASPNSDTPRVLVTVEEIACVTP